MYKESITLNDVQEHDITLSVNIKGENYPTRIVLNLGEVPFTTETDSHVDFLVEPHKGVCLIGNFPNDARCLLRRNYDESLFTEIIQHIEQMCEVMGYTIKITDTKIRDTHVLMPHVYIGLDILN